MSATPAQIRALRAVRDGEVRVLRAPGRTPRYPGPASRSLGACDRNGWITYDPERSEPLRDSLFTRFRAVLSPSGHAELLRAPSPSEGER